jgi:hypothetical protein
MKKFVSLMLVLALLLSSVGLVACGSNGDEKDVAEGNGQPTPADTSPGESASGDLPWDDIPVYPGSSLETSGPGPVQWQECKACQNLTYVTEDSPEDVCDFYKDKMSAQGWDKLLFQAYPEGACTGTWMTDMGDTSGPRVLMSIGKRASDKKTFASIILGTGCP